VALATSFVSTAGSWAVVPMGTLSDPLNTFWQVFFRATGAAAWSLVTPPGVADNGGLVSTGGASTVLTSGFEPSDDLRFSPTAQTADNGRSWSAGLLGQGLALVPDALGGAPQPAGPGLRALVRTAGGTVLASDDGLSGWRVSVSRRGLAATAAGRRCRLGALTGVAVADGATVVAGTCRSAGVVGLFTPGPTGWRLIGPPAGVVAGPTTVLRLSATGPDDLVALVAGARGSRLRVLWTADGGTTWTASPSLGVAPGSAVVSSGFGGSGAPAVVLLRRPGSAGLAAADVSPGAPAWRVLPRPPPGTAAVVEGPDGAVDALTVASTRMTDWALNASGSWTRGAVVVVPIQFGSSS